MMRLGVSTLLMISGVGLAAVPLVNFTSGPPLEATSQGTVQSVPAETVTAPPATYTAEAAQIVLRAEKRGFPLLNLRDGKRMQFGTANEAEPVSSPAQGRPLTLLNGDLDNDGAQELVAAYASSSGGFLLLHAGNPDSLGARTPEIFEGMKEGHFPAPFLPDAQRIELPIAPDFLGVGDFDRDGAKDIVVAARDGTTLVLLRGDGKGNFDAQSIALPGRATASIAENIDPLDGQIDLAVAIAGADGAAQLLVFDDAQNAFAGLPKTYPLPAEATALAVGQLDDDEPMDILAAAGGKAVVIHGKYRHIAAVAGEQVETLSEGSGVVAVRIGNFVWDRESLPEISLLAADGLIQILERNGIDKRMFTAAEWKTRWLVMRAEGLAQEAARHSDQALRQEPAPRPQWSETDRIQLAAPSGSDGAPGSSLLLTSARMTPLGVEDLIVVNPVSRQLQVLVSNTEELQATGELFAVSAAGARAAITFDVEGTPAAALPMRLNIMNRPGLVMLNEESEAVVMAPPMPNVTFTVNTTADTYDMGCTGGAGGCSLRDALDDANATMASDLIMVPAGTYTINPALGGPDQDTTIDPAAQQSGDWDVFFDTTIQGAGQATTILQAAAAQPGHDRVLDAIQTGVGIPDLTINDLTLANGRCRADFPCVDGGGLRYGVDALAVLTMSNVTVTNSRTEVNTANPANNGGGIFAGQADYNFTNLTVTNNIAGFATGGCTNCGSEGGGAIVAFTNGANPTSVTMNNCTFTGNQARTATSFGGRGGALAFSPNSVSITGGTFSNNTADIDGGAFRIFTATTISNATISGNSAKQQGGGIYNDPLDNQNNPLTNTFTNLVMRGNTADSNNALLAAGGEVTRGDGGAIYHGRGTLNLNNPIIGGTGAGEANTAFNGGGIGHSYAQFLSAAFNASTININNGGSIVGNLAINDGGGVLNDATRSAGGAATVLNIGATTAVTFTNNNARNNGGGIAMLTNAGAPTPAASGTLTNMTLRTNRANSDSSGGGDGGALYQNLAVSGGGTTFATALTIGGSGFGNQAVNGGGIRNNAGTVTIPANASITHNSASGTGGGISNTGTLSALSSATITNNTATGNGGGIFSSGTIGTLTNPALNNNSAASGGGIFNSNGTLVVSNGSVSNNTAGGGLVHGGSGASSVTGATINNNTGSGIFITANSLDVTNTTITGNTADGISKTAGTGSELISGNIIHSNGALGIDLGDNNVTPNDANDSDAGPNNLQNFPVLNYVKRTGEANVTLNSTANRQFRINYFTNTTCDASGNGEGEVALGTQNVTTNGSGTVTFNSAALAFGVREQITATATDTVTGDTSEFSACRKVNTVPVLTEASGVTRQQGSPMSTSSIGVVVDPDQALNTLGITANGNASATVNGVTISSLAIDATGNITANIIATCTATNANFTLRVTDNATEFDEATLTVTVTANTAPSVGNYSALTVNAGSSGTIVTPDAAPSDNGMLQSVTAAAPGFTGTFSGNTLTGAITINNAGPFGTYTVTVTTTDNCGLGTTAQFTLTVNAIPTVTAQGGLSRARGSLASTSQIATVNDADQTEETLVVTLNGGASATVNGVEVSSLALNSAGLVTATILTSCSATDATFTLRITDSNGAFNEATLSIAVTPNTNPSLGTYADTSLLPGGSTTVMPTAAPADNGSIASVTVVAPGFNGTLSVDPATGVVTVDNATPAGSYTVTVTVTDNCGAQTPRTFALTVNTPPVAGTDAMGTPRNTPADAPVVKLLLNDSDADSNAINITGVNASSTQGGTVVLGATAITYTPPTNFTGTDTFAYILSDSLGGTTLGTVTVEVGLTATSNIITITTTPAEVILECAGIPGESYVIQAADNVAGPYTDLSSPIAAEADGRFEYRDTTQPQPAQRFYRVRSNP